MKIKYRSIALLITYRQVHKVNLVQPWNLPPQNLGLKSDEVHIWCANLDLSAIEISRLTNILSTDERDKANKFRFEKHRNRYTVARGRLRQLLANYLHISAKDIQFEYSDRGKPSLSHQLNQDNLQFNVSHSQNLALYAFTYHHRIGIDLEYLRVGNDAAQIARRFFSPAEYELIANLEKNRQQEVFLHIWTIKEAYLKATGEGLSGSLDTTEVSFQGDIPTGLKASNWLVHSFIPADNFMATVALENKDNVIQKQQIKFWNMMQT